MRTEALIEQRKELASRLAVSEGRLTALEVVISDERVRGERLQRVLAEKDRLTEEIDQCRGQLDLLDREIRHREQAPPAHSIRFVHEVGDDGLPVDSIRHLTW
jgi:hypothetical protein